MAKLNLDLGEKIIMETPRGVIPQDDEKAQKYYVSLVLTNKAIYIQYLSIWTRAVKETRRIPLTAITIYEGNAQVRIRRIGLYHALSIYTKNETFEFVMAGSGKVEVKRWADTISRLITGHDAVAFEDGQSIYTDAVKDIISTLKGSKNELDNTIPEDIECAYSVENIDEAGDSKSTIDTQIDMVKNLKELLDMGAITKDEFDRKNKEILGL